MYGDYDGYSSEYSREGISFALIVVLFVLLIIRRSFFSRLLMRNQKGADYFLPPFTITNVL
ncbi:YjcZ family sporulation protein [Lederbergia wuyishanensis]|uniref:YjcZ family sporulation protein n=1 Tax=Lederbergia wuyishanensis TaxID=1347903 RepID=UPI0024586675|nr:YjcZ family sporulation protein [Lederbergia wuyishanensis]